MREKYTQDWLEQYYFSFTECLRSKFGIKLANQFPEFDFDVFCKDFKSHIYKAYLQVCITLCTNYFMINPHLKLKLSRISKSSLDVNFV